MYMELARQPSDRRVVVVVSLSVTVYVWSCRFGCFGYFLCVCWYLSSNESESYRLSMALALAVFFPTTVPIWNCISLLSTFFSLSAVSTFKPSLFSPHGYIHGMWSQLDLFSRWGFPIYNATTVNKRNIAAVALGNKWQVYQTTASLPCQWRQKNIGKRKRITKYCIIQAATGEVNAHRWNYSKVVIQFLYVAEKNWNSM